MRLLSDFLCVFIFVTLFAAPQLISAAPLVLTAQERHLIETTDLPNGMEFPEFFATLVHHLEQCQEEEDSKQWRTDCTYPLRKRVSDIRVTYGWETRRSKLNRKFDRQRFHASIMMEKLSQATGIQFLNTGKLLGTYMNIVFAERELYESDPEDFLLKYVAFPEHPFRERKHRDFEMFMADERHPCAYFGMLFEDHKIYDVEIWIKGEIDRGFMEKCVVEEIYNSMGLTEGQMIGGLFDYDFMLTRTEDSLNLLIPSDFALLMLKILYSEDMKLGQSEKDTIAAVKRILARPIQ